MAHVCDVLQIFFTCVREIPKCLFVILIWFMSCDIFMVAEYMVSEHM